MRVRGLVLAAAALACLGSPGALAAQECREGSGIEGMIDLHAHTGPDMADTPYRRSQPNRSVDAIEAAMIARRHCMRAIVLKNHYLETASQAYLVSQFVPGIEIYGGVAMNSPVGGLNPVAVANMWTIAGGHGRVVYMPTFESENYNPGSEYAIPISRDGALLPDALAVLDAVAEHDLGLSTGHSTAEENLMLIRAARERGIDKIYVQHPQGGRINMSMDQMSEAASMGALIEFVMGGGLSDERLAQIRELGPENVVLTSDEGQMGGGLHTDAFRRLVPILEEAGFTQSEIDIMTKHNPAFFLGLEPRRPAAE